MLVVDFRGVEEAVLSNVPGEYQAWLGEFEEFLSLLVRRLFISGLNGTAGRGDLYRLGLLLHGESKEAVRARVNAYYAFLVHRGYITVTEALRHVAGAESLYTWLRFYRRLIGDGKYWRALGILMASVPREYMDHVPGFMNLLTRLGGKPPFNRLLWGGQSHAKALLNAFYAYLTCTGAIGTSDLVNHGVQPSGVEKWVSRLRSAGACD